MPADPNPSSPARLILLRLGIAAAAAALLLTLYRSTQLGEPLRWLDEGLFYFLNGLLGHAEWYDKLLIFLNQRFVDYSVAALIGLSYIAYMFQGGGKKLRQRFHFGLVILCIMVPSIFINKAIVPHIGRYDPAEKFNGHCVNLQVLYPEIHQHNAASRECFPADHGIVVFSFFWITFYANRRRSPAVLLGAIFLILPRLTVGGHWLTDMLAAAISASILPSILDAFLNFSDPKWGITPRPPSRFGVAGHTRRILPGSKPLKT